MNDEGITLLCRHLAHSCSKSTWRAAGHYPLQQVEGEEICAYRIQARRRTGIEGACIRRNALRLLSPYVLLNILRPQRRTKRSTKRGSGSGGDASTAFIVRLGCVPASRYAVARFLISSGERSSLCVAINQICPKGSSSAPVRSP